MELSEFIAGVTEFASLSHPEKVKHFAWYLHIHRGLDRFTPGAIRDCYVAVHLEPPNLSKEFQRLQDRAPRQLLRDGSGYRLEHRVRSELDRRYGIPANVATVSQLLKDLPGRISNDAERLFLSEAMKCYQVGAYRAAIVMAWNLAYDHLLNWLLLDAARLSAFNSKILGRVGPKKGAGLAMSRREDFEDLKESEVLDICGTAGVFSSDNIKKVLDVQLTKRNLAAHPSLLEIGAPQADDAIYDLVTNVVLKLV